jgi:type I restriction enzyme S subunit
MVRPNLEGFAHISGEASNIIVSTGFAVITVEKADPSFIYHALFGSKIVGQLNRLLVGSGYPAINSTDVEELVLALPCKLDEQRKIAEILSTWDEALEKVDALIEAKERRKKALMQQLLTGKKRVKGFSEPWIRTRMSTFLTRVFRPIEWHPDLPLSLVSLRRRFGGLFRRPDVLGSEYKTRDLHELKKDDFLISKRQVVHGAWAFVTSEFEATHVSKEYVILISSAPDRLYMPFFGWFAQTPRMLRLARVSSTGVHIEKLIFDADVFLKEAIRIPQNIDEQRAISEILNNADREIRLLRTERGALDQQKRGLMQRLLTGKVRVKV